MICFFGWSGSSQCRKGSQAIHSYIIYQWSGMVQYYFLKSVILPALVDWIWGHDRGIHRPHGARKLGDFCAISPVTFQGF